jgi:hypothetical protein
MNFAPRTQPLIHVTAFVLSLLGRWFATSTSKHVEKGNDGTTDDDDHEENDQPFVDRRSIIVPFGDFSWWDVPTFVDVRIELGIAVADVTWERLHSIFVN